MGCSIDVTILIVNLEMKTLPLIITECNYVDLQLKHCLILMSLIRQRKKTRRQHLVQTLCFGLSRYSVTDFKEVLSAAKFQSYFCQRLSFNARLNL